MDRVQIPLMWLWFALQIATCLLQTTFLGWQIANQLPCKKILWKSKKKNPWEFKCFSNCQFNKLVKGLWTGSASANIRPEYQSLYYLFTILLLSELEQTQKIMTPKREAEKWRAFSHSSVFSRCFARSLTRMANTTDKINIKYMETSKREFSTRIH